MTYFWTFLVIFTLLLHDLLSFDEKKADKYTANMKES